MLFTWPFAREGLLSAQCHSNADIGHPSRWRWCWYHCPVNQTWAAQQWVNDPMGKRKKKMNHSFRTKVRIHHLFNPMCHLLNQLHQLMNPADPLMGEMNHLAELRNLLAFQFMQECISSQTTLLFNVLHNLLAPLYFLNISLKGHWYNQAWNLRYRFGTLMYPGIKCLRYRFGFKKKHFLNVLDLTATGVHKGGWCSEVFFNLSFTQPLHTSAFELINITCCS